MPNKVIVEIKTKTDDNGWSIPVELTYDDERFEIKNPDSILGTQLVEKLATLG